MCPCLTPIQMFILSKNRQPGEQSFTWVSCYTFIYCSVTKLFIVLPFSILSRRREEANFYDSNGIEFIYGTNGQGVEKNFIFAILTLLTVISCVILLKRLEELRVNQLSTFMSRNGFVHQRRLRAFVGLKDGRIF